MFRHSDEALTRMQEGNADCADLFTDPELEEQKRRSAELTINGLTRCVGSFRHNDGKNSRGEHNPSFA